MLRKFFRHTPLGRTISLRNKTGKGVAGFALSLIGFKTGVDTGLISETIMGAEMMADLHYSEVLLYALGLFLSVVVGQGWITKSIADEVEDLVRVYLRAKRSDSEAGIGLSPTEKDAIFAELTDLIEEIMQRFGIQLDLDGDGK